MPYHVLLDQAGEARLGKLRIGTTRRGIGPCYADKAARLGIRVQDLLDETILRKKIMAALEPKRQALRPHAKDPALDLHAMTEEYVHLRPPARAPHRRHGAALPRDARRAAARWCSRAPRARCSTSTTAPIRSSPPRTRSPAPPASAPASGPTRIDEVWGVAKAYATRVGGGPFPTELDDDIGRHLLERGHEYGTTTGRQRRCGWLDLVALRYAARINGLTALRHHEARRARRHRPAAGLHAATATPRARCSRTSPTTSRSCTAPRPMYEELPGFDEDIGDCRRDADLPREARDYLEFVTDFVGVPVQLVGVGPGRDQVIWMGEAEPTLRAA